MASEWVPYQFVRLNLTKVGVLHFEVQEGFSGDLII